MIFKGRGSPINLNFIMDNDLADKYLEKLRGGVQWYMMQSKDIISSICFKFEKLKQGIKTI